MKNDPAYLRNQSRSLHAAYRRNRRFLNVSVGLWSGLFLALFAIALFGRIARLGWTFSDDIWAFFGFACFGLVFWVFGKLILKLQLAYIRHTYGAEPTD
jgi:hypothetical protein